MIRTQLMNQLEETLSNHSRFDSKDFIITTEALRNKIPKIVIKYRYDEKFWFEAVLPRGKTAIKDPYEQNVYKIEVALSPGELNTQESYAVHNKDGLFQSISEWQTFLKVELNSSPERREIEEQRKQLDELISSINDMPDEYFKKSESDEVIQRLNELEERMKAVAAEAKQTKAELEQRISNIEKDFTILRDNLSILSKKNWVKSVLSRTIGWAQDPVNQKLIKSGADVAKALLTDGSPTTPPE